MTLPDSYNLINPETGLFDFEAYRNSSPLNQAMFMSTLKNGEFEELSKGDTRMFQDSVKGLVDSNQITDMQASKILTTAGTGKPTELPLQGQEAIANAEQNNIFSQILDDRKAANFMFWGPENIGDRGKYARDNLLARYKNDPTSNEFLRANEFINNWKDHTIKLPNGEKSEIPLGILMDAISKAERKSWLWTSSDDLDSALTDLLKDPVTLERIEDSISLRNEVYKDKAKQSYLKPNNK
ncbi:MAG: hypothetical protein GX040_11165 [Alcaligenaceae bacterium]|nr:hypothetical protein [Alcaligenaceae bacterium]